MSHLPDEVLARRAAAGHMDCFEEILGRYRDRVYRLCYRMAGNAEDAEDWAQEAFVRAYRHLTYYDPALPFAPWLLSVASRVCLNQVKSRGRHHERVSFAFSEETTPSKGRVAESGQRESGGDPLRVLLDKEQTGAIQEAIQELSPTLRQAILLRVQEDLSFREVADILGVPLQTAATRIRRALLQMRERLGRRERGEAEPVEYEGR